MIIKMEPDLMGLAYVVELVYDVGEAKPFRVQLQTSHACVGEDLYRLGVALAEMLVPAQLVTAGRLS